LATWWDANGLGACAGACLINVWNSDFVSFGLKYGLDPVAAGATAGPNALADAPPGPDSGDHIGEFEDPGVSEPGELPGLAPGGFTSPPLK
jgi:hypothetical protein